MSGLTSCASCTTHTAERGNRLYGLLILRNHHTLGVTYLDFKSLLLELECHQTRSQKAFHVNPVDFCICPRLVTFNTKHLSLIRKHSVMERLGVKLGFVTFC